MQQYILRRLLLTIPVLFIVSVIVFGSIRIIPGDAVMLQLAESGNVPKARLAQLRHDLGLDAPVHEQYVTWITGIIFHGNFGKSLWSGKYVTDEIKRTVPITLELAFLSTVLGIAIGIPFGLISAMRQDTLSDYIARLFSIGGLSVPDFVLGTVSLLMFSLVFLWVPPLTYSSPFVHWFNLPIAITTLDIPRLASPEILGKNLTQFALPSVILAFGFSAGVMRMMRSSMLEVFREDYVRTAWAKGLRERVVILRHTLKNAMIPVITVIGYRLAFSLGGAFAMEYIFGLPGMARLTLDAINQRDYPQIQANVLVIAVVIVLANLVIDVSYAWFDPRIRYR